MLSGGPWGAECMVLQWGGGGGGGWERVQRKESRTGRSGFQHIVRVKRFRARGIGDSYPY